LSENVTFSTAFTTEDLELNIFFLMNCLDMFSSLRISVNKPIMIINYIKNLECVFDYAKRTLFGQNFGAFYEP